VNDLQDRIEEAIESHIEWAYDKNNGRVTAKTMSDTIMQVIKSNIETPVEDVCKKQDKTTVNIKPKKCQGCGGYLFYIDELPDCETCKFNGAFLDDANGYIYEPVDIEYHQLHRDQAETEGECMLGTTFNAGCHLYQCPKCKTKSHWPTIYE